MTSRAACSPAASSLTTRGQIGKAHLWITGSTSRPVHTSISDSNDYFQHFTAIQILNDDSFASTLRNIQRATRPSHTPLGVHQHASLDAKQRWVSAESLFISGSSSVSPRCALYVPWRSCLKGRWRPYKYGFLYMLSPFSRSVIIRSRIHSHSSYPVLETARQGAGATSGKIGTNRSRGTRQMISRSTRDNFGASASR